MTLPGSVPSSRCHRHPVAVNGVCTITNSSVIWRTRGLQLSLVLLCFLPAFLPTQLTVPCAEASPAPQRPAGDAPGATSSTERCTNDQYQRCLVSLESVAKGEDITLVTSKRELDHVCKKLKRVVDCVDEHTAQCFETTLQRLFNQVVAGAKETIAEVCLPGDTQDDFLRHARCNRNVTLGEDKCAPAYRRTLELAKTIAQAENIDHGLRRSCCAFSEFVECKSFHVERDCGDRASAFFARHMQRISGPLIEDHCGHYAHGGGCDDAATSGATQLSSTPATFHCWLLLTIVALATVANFWLGAGKYEGPTSHRGRGRQHGAFHYVCPDVVLAYQCSANPLNTSQSPAASLV